MSKRSFAKDFGRNEHGFGKSKSTAKKSLPNLNELIIADGHHDDEAALAREFAKPRNAVSSDGNTSVYFRNLEEEMIKLIEDCNVVVGCVAWLTNERILRALAKKETVSIVIQKEDFLRPDSDNWTGEKLRKLYAALPEGVSIGGVNIGWNGYYDEDEADETDTVTDIDDASEVMSVLRSLNYNGDQRTNAVRWMGNFNNEKSPSFPRMHNKFLVFCDFVGSPKAVWTGSFNLTDNATRSLENAVVIRDQKIVDAYHLEWEYIFALSENIPNEHWKHRWEPEEFRIGT